MAKRYIGIELDGETARVALLTEDGGNLVLELRKQGYGSAEQAREVLAELTGGARALGDHLVTALPAGAGFFRSLNFPFKERSKLAAVLPSELDARMPISLARYTCAMHPPRERDGSYDVDAAAVRNEAIEALLEHFPDPAQHPRRIDLLPHALAGGLAVQDGLLAYCGREETQVALLSDGRVVEFRLLPGGAGEEEIGRFVLSQLQQLERMAGRQDLPFWICGAAVSEKLLELCQAGGRPPVEPDLALSLAEREIPAEFLPATLLALAEKGPGRQNGFNFRVGAFAPQGQLEMLKKKLIASGVLLLLCLTVLVGTGYFDYHRKARQAELLKQQLEGVFRQTLPQATAVFDVPLQLQSHLKELRQQALLLGVGDRVTALNALETLSTQTGPEIKSDLKELTYSSEQLRLDGYTDSFDSVNRITQALGRSPLFTKVEISEARMAADGGQVDFKLQIDLRKTGGAL
ncbi:MAG TPA: type II secretion system protein GspL [Geopsychrobacteraceae bacterium]|jgi:Tfp pilus assembly protein PilN